MTILIRFTLVVLFAMPAWAQDETTEATSSVSEETLKEESDTETKNPPKNENGRVEKLEVTGSYIRRTDVEGPSPVITIDREKIEKSGFNTVGALLSRSTATPFGGDGSSVSLKGIGSGRTLILINGQRAPGSGSSYASGAVSPNFVPLAAVERIEILKDGASATYGSDALGGVINIITRKDLDGFSFANQYNMTNVNGGDNNRMSLAYGKQTSKSNFLSSLQYTFAQGNRSSDLDYAKELNSSFPFSGNYEDDAGDIQPAPGCTRLKSGVCQELVSPKQINLASHSLDWVTDFSYNMGSDITLFATLIAGYGLSSDKFPNVLNTPGDNIGMAVPAGTGPASWNTTLPGYSGINDGRIWYRFDDYVNKSTVQGYNGGLILGLKGYIGNSDWDWTVTTNNQFNINETKEENLATLSGATAAILTNQTYDPFDPTKRNLSGLGIDAMNRNRAIVNWVDARTTGDMGHFVGIDWAAAFGTSFAHFEYADHRADAIVSKDTMLQSGVVGKGARELYSLYTELSGMIGKQAEIQLSGRGDFYSDFGSTINPKLAFRYQPANWITLRTSAGTGFQAPTLQDMNARIEGYDFLTDQVRCKDPGIADCDTKTVSVFQSNNPNLKQETSSTFNLGTILQPTRNLSFSVDYWWVNVNNTIGTDLNDILRLEQMDPTSPGRYGVNIQRRNNDPTDIIERITYQLYNVGKEQADGIDFEGNWRLPTKIGKFSFTDEFTYMNHYYEQFYAEFGKQQVLGQFEKPRWKNNFTVSHSLGKISSQILFRSLADVENRVRTAKIVSPTQIDIAITYDPEWAGSFQLGGINVFNIRPRFDQTYASRISGNLFQRYDTYYLTYKQDF
jgi:iron complex outermembrane recepter protein